MHTITDTQETGHRQGDKDHFGVRFLDEDGASLPKTIAKVSNPFFRSSNWIYGSSASRYNGPIQL